MKIYFPNGEPPWGIWNYQPGQKTQKLIIGENMACSFSSDHTVNHPGGGKENYGRFHFLGHFICMAKFMWQIIDCYIWCEQFWYNCYFYHADLC